MAKTKTKAKSKTGLSAKVYSGLSKSRIAQRAASNTPRLIVDKGKTKTIQFLDQPTAMKEYDVHSFREKGKWVYVPCIEGKCPLCEDEEREVSKTSYRFLANVWSFKDKKVVVLEGGVELSEKILHRFERKKKFFMKRTWDLTKMSGERITWDIDQGEKAPLRDTSDLKLYDLDEYIAAQIQRYYGTELPDTSKAKKTALDDDDDDDAEEDEYDEETLEEMSRKELVKVARSMEISLKNKEGDKASDRLLIKRILKAQG